MISLRHHLLLPLLLLQGGCAVLTSYSKVEPQIDQWVENREYDRALDALGSIDAKDPQYQQAAEKRRHVEALAANYEQEIRRQTRQNLDQGKWAEALDTYDEALGRLPQSAVLKDGLAQLHHEQGEELERLELERLLAHGQWLKQILPTYHDIVRVDPRSRSARQRLEKKQQEAKEIASELALYGNKALANSHLDIADQTLSLAAELSDAPAIEESLKKLRQQQAKVKAKAQEERHHHRQQQRAAEQAKARRVAELLKAYRKAFANKDYTTASKQLKALQRTDKGNDKWDRLATELEHATEQEAERVFDRGVSAYSRGNFEQAANLWRQALELNPNHKLAQENLERAERVLEKLQQLKQKQSK
jgi:tetratricopeptide (TPR) repeat protein